MENIIKINDLHKSFNSNHVEFEVLKGINLEINEGEFVSIMGPSGSGKSTLLYLMGGLDAPSKGDIYINDKKIDDLNDKQLSILRQEEIGFVFQFYNLVQHLSVEENILLPLTIQGKNTKKHEAYLTEILEAVGLLDKRKSLPRELSGGQQQRVAIARALINSPRIILADEPTGNLDSKATKEIMDLFKKINKLYKTVIVQVTHSKETAEYGNRIINVKDGILV
ncbi:macrolide ABC transporter ATP-binding protein [Candidatus Izimaplasma bacterium ZiA1]|uniref:ABC transporter ATP-binding protein n=1 Tax=Candidatus Izimoplasma sp. ZiA1 TaxID=2024899 RepID=UPI000BAA5707|nr:macrolide ABC transporter ATP-binding protein [Candidatus Izimaplasma bacterium ZiA1]